jgi:hypothetical protein
MNATQETAAGFAAVIVVMSGDAKVHTRNCCSTLGASLHMVSEIAG